MTLTVEYLDGDIYEYKTRDTANSQGILHFTPLSMIGGEPEDETTLTMIHIPHCVLRKWTTEWDDVPEEVGFIALENKGVNKP